MNIFEKKGVKYHYQITLQCVEIHSKKRVSKPAYASITWQRGHSKNGTTKVSQLTDKSNHILDGCEQEIKFNETIQFYATLIPKVFTTRRDSIRGVVHKPKHIYFTLNEVDGKHVRKMLFGKFDLAECVSQTLSVDIPLEEKFSKFSLFGKKSTKYILKALITSSTDGEGVYDPDTTEGSTGGPNEISEGTGSGDGEVSDDEEPVGRKDSYHSLDPRILLNGSLRLVKSPRGEKTLSKSFYTPKQSEKNAQVNQQSGKEEETKEQRKPEIPTPETPSPVIKYEIGTIEVKRETKDQEIQTETVKDIEKEQYKRTIEQLKGEIEELNRKISELQNIETQDSTTKIQLQLKIQKIESEKKECLSQLTKIMAINRGLESTIKIIEEEREKTKSFYVTKNKQLEEKLDDSYRENNALRDELEPLRDKLEDAKLENTSLKTHIKDQEEVIENLQKMLQKKPTVVSKPHNPIAHSILWGLIASIFVVLSVPFRVDFGLKTQDEIITFIARQAVGAFAMYTFFTYCGIRLGAVYKLKTNLLNYLTDPSLLYSNDLREDIRKSCLWGVCLALAVMTADSVFFGSLIDGLPNSSSVIYWRRLSYSLSEGIIDELIARFFLFTFCIALLQRLLEFAKRASNVNAASTFLESLKQKIARMIEKILGSNEDSVVYYSIMISCIVYVLIIKLPPKLAFFTPISTFQYIWFIVREIVLNGATGVAFCYMFYTQETIELTMLSHTVLSIVLYIFAGWAFM